MSYWLNLFTVETWRQFKNAGASVSGFSIHRLTAAKRLQRGDRLLCYLVRASKWIAVLRVTGDTYIDEDLGRRIWTGRNYPVCVPVKVELELHPESGVPVGNMVRELDATAGLGVRGWGRAFMSSPAHWSDADGQVVYAAIANAAGEQG